MEIFLFAQIFLFYFLAQTRKSDKHLNNHVSCVCMVCPCILKCNFSLGMHFLAPYVESYIICWHVYRLCQVHGWQQIAYYWRQFTITIVAVLNEHIYFLLILLCVLCILIIVKKLICIIMHFIWLLFHNYLYFVDLIERLLHFW